jgi:hypothetical protein
MLACLIRRRNHLFDALIISFFSTRIIVKRTSGNAILSEGGTLPLGIGDGRHGQTRTVRIKTRERLTPLNKRRFLNRLVGVWFLGRI